MTKILKEYDAKVDSKKRITLRDAMYEYYHIEEFDDGSIILKPRELVPPSQVSVKTLSMMDNSIENLKQGKVSEAVNLTEFEH